MNEFLLGLGIGLTIWTFGLSWVVIKHIHDDDDDYE